MTLPVSTKVLGPYVARSLLITDAEGRDRVLTVVKVAWTAPVHGGGFDPDRGHVLRQVAELHDERPGASVRAPSDLAPEKPGTEILLTGHARRPWAYPDARWVDVTLSVARDATLLRKTLRVYGRRTWVRDGDVHRPSEPAPCEDTPLRWEWAYGGSDGGATDPRNPVGRGFGGERGAHPAAECHRIELASASASGAPQPAGFGAVAAHWEPRRSRAGTPSVDEPSPHPPADRHPLFYLSAPDDQWFAEPLVGGETVVVTGVHAERAWTVTLPALAPEVTWTLSGRTERAAPHLDTIFLDADAWRVELAWRVSFPMPRRADSLEAIVVRDSAARRERSIRANVAA